MDVPVEPAPLCPLPRPDGRLQLGLGPGAWVVEGWSPDTSCVRDPTTALLRGMRRPPSPGQAPAWVVLGEGELARRLRGLSRVAAAPASNGADDDPETAVVLVNEHLVPVGTARREDLKARAVLPVVLQTGRIAVGPWTGLAGWPCLHCLDLHRCDRDSAWPALAVAADDPLRQLDAPDHDTVVVDLAVALVQLLVRALPGPRSPTLGLGYEVAEPAPHVVTRRWPVHPACRWHGPDGR